MNDLSNISAISMVAIEESRMGNLTTLTATRLEEPDPLEALDMSKMPTEMFLDGCKVRIGTQNLITLTVTRLEEPDPL